MLHFPSQGETGTGSACSHQRHLGIWDRWAPRGSWPHRSEGTGRHGRQLRASDLGAAAWQTSTHTLLSSVKSPALLGKEQTPGKRLLRAQMTRGGGVTSKMVRDAYLNKGCFPRKTPRCYFARSRGNNGNALAVSSCMAAGVTF